MKQKENIIVVGSANTDIVIGVERFPKPGETIAGHGFLTNRGGKGANQAMAAARLGGSVAFVGKVGNDDYGRQTIEALNDEGIDTRYMLKTDETHSGVAVITIDGHGENSIIVDGGANMQLSAADIEAAEEVFRDAAIVLLQLETPVDALTAAARLAHRHGAYVVLNPAPAPKSPLPEALLSHVDLLIPNQTEAELFCGYVVDSMDTAAKAISDLREKGIRQTIITMGGQGAVVGIEAEHVAAYPTTVVDTTAAGDTFCGALCSALVRGSSLKEAADFACRAASVTVSRMGAQQAMPRLEEIEAMSL